MRSLRPSLAVVLSSLLFAACASQTPVRPTLQPGDGAFAEPPEGERGGVAATPEPAAPDPEPSETAQKSQPMADDEARPRGRADAPVDLPRPAAAAPPMGGALDSSSGPGAAGSLGGVASRSASASVSPARPASKAAEERPGLATRWGEARSSHVTDVSFDRANPQPDALTSLAYNDRDGAHAVAGSGAWPTTAARTLPLAAGRLTVTLQGDGGGVLSAFAAGDRVVAVGEVGRRYTIVLSNQSPERVEAVASVDGLDVLDGKPAAFSKRGYLVAPWSTLAIEGFRKSQDEVAAFRFGSVRDSYAAKTSGDRHVGVIGVAVFEERGARPAWPWTPSEVRRRRTADPFPGRFAAPPPGGD